MLTTFSYSRTALLKPCDRALLLANGGGFTVCGIIEETVVDGDKGRIHGTKGVKAAVI